MTLPCSFQLLLVVASLPPLPPSLPHPLPCPVCHTSLCLPSIGTPSLEFSHTQLIHDDLTSRSLVTSAKALDPNKVTLQTFWEATSEREIE